MEFIFFVLFLVIILNLFNRFSVRFFGYGKGFSRYYHPKKCCKSDNCYPGMYLGNEFWNKNK